MSVSIVLCSSGSEIQKASQTAVREAEQSFRVHATPMGC